MRIRDRRVDHPMAGELVEPRRTKVDCTCNEGVSDHRPAGLVPGNAESNSAATPDATGVAADVPLS